MILASNHMSQEMKSGDFKKVCSLILNICLLTDFHVVLPDSPPHVIVPNILFLFLSLWKLNILRPQSATKMKAHMCTLSDRLPSATSLGGILGSEELALPSTQGILAAACFARWKPTGCAGSDSPGFLPWSMGQQGVCLCQDPYRECDLLRDGSWCPQRCTALQFHPGSGFPSVHPARQKRGKDF